MFVGFVTQLCSPSNVCVLSVDRRRVHTQSSLSVFITLGTTVLSSLRSGVVCLVVKLTYLHQIPFWLWLVWTNSPIFTPTSVQTSRHKMPRLPVTVMDTRQVREYPESTISKVSTVLKWRMITALNRKQLEKQTVQNRFASNEVQIGHFFLQCQCYCQFFFNRLTLSIFRFLNFSPD